MRAIILAAGVGSRLRPITDKKPKTMVTVNNKPMIGHIIDALIQAEVPEIVVCTGYRADQLQSYLTEIYQTKVELIFVNNPVYETTNNMYSLYLAREYLRGDLLLMNADLVFDPSIISSLVEFSGSAIAVDKGNYLDEAMKVVVEHNVVKNISKKICIEDSYGCSIDIYKFNSNACEVLNKEVVEIVEVEKDLNQWTEVLLDRVFANQKVVAVPMDIGDRKWFEIDNYTDLANAEILFNTELAGLKNKKLFILDRDGTVSLGSTEIDGASEFIDRLECSETIKWTVGSNNSSKTAKQHEMSLEKIFPRAEKFKVTTSLEVAIQSLINKGFKKIFWVANESVSIELSDFFEFETNNPEACLLTYDNEINYEKILTLIRHVKEGCPFYATHIDVVCPTEDGFIPDAGCFLSMIHACTNKYPVENFGKPTRNYLNYLLEKFSMGEHETVLIGDRLYTDIAMCEDTKVVSVLVLSGETSRTDYEFSDLKADIIVPSLKYLLHYIK